MRKICLLVTVFFSLSLMIPSVRIQAQSSAHGTQQIKTSVRVDCFVNERESDPIGERFCQAVNDTIARSGTYFLDASRDKLPDGGLLFNIRHERINLRQSHEQIGSAIATLVSIGWRVTKQNHDTIPSLLYSDLVVLAPDDAPTSPAQDLLVAVDRARANRLNNSSATIVKSSEAPNDRASTPCHELIQQIAALPVSQEIDFREESEWDDKIFDCRYKTPNQILSSDWPTLVEIESRFRQNDIHFLSAGIDTMQSSHMALLNDQLKNYVSKKDYDDLWTLAKKVDDNWTTDYNQLVSKHNNLLQTLRSVPPSALIPARRQSIHCTGMNLGVISTIDCY